MYYILDIGTNWEWPASLPGRFTAGERGPVIASVT
jgi:hypothetical protein